MVFTKGTVCIVKAFCQSPDLAVDLFYPLLESENTHTSATVQIHNATKGREKKNGYGPGKLIRGAVTLIYDIYDNANTDKGEENFKIDDVFIQIPNGDDHYGDLQGRKKADYEKVREK